MGFGFAFRNPVILLAPPVPIPDGAQTDESGTNWLTEDGSQVNAE